MISAKELTRSAVVFSILVAFIAGAAGILIHARGDAREEPNGKFANTRLSMRELETASSRLPRQGAALRATDSANGDARIASVPSLIGGLEKRLESNPDDARGWALLAQSYAFTGRLDAAERALQRAVALGADETDLRQRVQSASRDPHAAIASAQTPAR